MKKEEMYISVQLNQIKYTEEDCVFLNDGSIRNMKSKFSLNHWPSAVGWDAIFITLGILKAFELVTEGFLSELGADLYNWSKNKLSKITCDKEDFDESRINIKFENCNINIYCNKKDDLHYATENMKDILITVIRDGNHFDKEIDIDIEEIKRRNE
jgi:hypothetical protein